MPISEQNPEGCDATKMPKDLKLGTKDCFGFASQDDSNTFGDFIN